MGLIRSNIYKWHRTCSLIIAIPVLLWASSGFMHPIMTNIRPKIATQGLTPVPVDSSKIRVPLQAALRMHHLDSISNFRMIHIDTNWFYQVQLAAHHASGSSGGAKKDGSGSPAYPGGANIPVYLSCLNGNVLPAGDWLYAQYLARQFLEGPTISSGNSHAPVTSAAIASHASAASPAGSLGPANPTAGSDRPARPDHSDTNGSPAVGSPAPATSTAVASALVHALDGPATAGLTGSASAAATLPDCCGAATDCVLNPVRGSKVANVSLLKNYDLEYKSINKILPVYRVSFDRPDGIRVYVETTRDRFAFAMDKRRYVFDRIFTLVHTWAWLDFLGKGKSVIEFCLIAMAFLTAVMGIYIFFTTKAKKANGNALMKARRLHRYTSISIALFTLMFTFSGAFHVLSKFKEDTRDRFFVSPSFASAGLNFDFSSIQQSAGSPITDVSIVSMYGRAYWQVTARQGHSQQASAQTAGAPESGEHHSSAEPAAGIASPATHSGDLMKDQQVPASLVTYVQTDSPYTPLPQGEMKYAAYLASTFSGQSPTDILSTEPVLRFTSEYNFADKRLPVWKVSYASHDHERYYVETSTGRLSKRVTDNSMLEEYSFAFLHKHEFMGWGGKGLKDFSTMFWALAQIVMVTVGLMLYFKYRRRPVNK